MVPLGKGVFIWQLSASSGGDPVAMASRAHEAGMEWVAIKVQNGKYLWNADLMGAATQAFKGAGVEVWGWGYVGGKTSVPLGHTVGSAAEEAAATVKAVKDYGIDGFIIDAEKEYKREGASGWARTYMQGVRAVLPKYPIGLCSYRFPSLHPQIPWSVFLASCDFHMPQVYWEQAHNPAAQLVRSVKELKALKNLPVIPVGAAYPAGSWAPTVADLDAFDRTAHAQGLPGVGWWSWQAMDKRPDWWAAVAAHQWGGPVAEAEPSDAEKLDILWRDYQERIA